MLIPSNGSIDSVSYFSGIPSNFSIPRAYYLCYNYELNSDKTDIIGAYLFKWFNESLIEVTERNAFIGHSSIITFKQVELPEDRDKTEKDLYRILYFIKGTGILDKNDFTVWAQQRSNFYFMKKWFDDVFSAERESLLSQGLIYSSENKSKNPFIGSYNDYIPSSDLNNEAIQLAGLQKYFKDHKLVSNISSIDADLFGNYLIIAQLLGVARGLRDDFNAVGLNLLDTSKLTSLSILFKYWLNLHELLHYHESDEDRRRRELDPFNLQDL